VLAAAASADPQVAVDRAAADLQPLSDLTYVDPLGGEVVDLLVQRNKALVLPHATCFGLLGPPGEPWRLLDDPALR
jgi:hypothetical protein